MLYNKNNVRKTNDKKILHKVGKQWKVISVALLMAVAGGAVATHAANAAQTNDADDASVNTLVNTLNTSAAANAPRYAVKPSATSANSSVAPSASTSVNYYSGDNGSAAKYFDKVESDNAVAAKYYNTVNNYVQSLTNEYQPQVSSFAAKSASAKSATSNDSKLANSYGATAKKNTTFNTINSLAAKNHMDPNLYEGMVQNNEQTYSGAVSSASANVKAASDVNSLVNSLEGANLSAASLSASTATVIAASNYNGAVAVSNSVNARYNDKGNDATAYLTIANKLSAGVQTLLAEGDPRGYQAQLSMLLTDNSYNAAQQNSASSAVNSAVAAAVSSAKVDYSYAAKNFDNLSDYANGEFDALVHSGDAALQNANPEKLNLENGQNSESEYTAAVSAATAEQFAATLQSAATSLYSKFNPQLANAQTLSAERSSAIASASAGVRATSFAYDVAADNEGIIDTVSAKAGSNSDEAASYARTLLNGGVTGFEVGLHLARYNNDTGYNSTIHSHQVFANTLYHNQSLLDQDDFAEFAKYTINNASTADEVSNNINRVIAGLDYVAANLDANRAIAKGNDATSNIVNLLAHHVENQSQNNTEKANAVKALTRPLSKLANLATKLISSKDYNGLDNNAPQLVAVNNTAADEEKAALLSDGVDIDALNAESGAIDNVIGAANKAYASDAALSGFNVNSSAINLENALSTAASSADSSLVSASNASASYSAANDEDVTLASYFASSYTSDTNSESAVAVSASNALNHFFINMAADPTFANADTRYTNAEDAAANDYKLGVGNAQAVYNRLPHFLDVLKGARLHSTPNYGSKDDKVVGSANKGDRLTVYGVNVSRNNDWRGVVRYYVLDNTTGKKGFFTGQDGFSKGAYLSATVDHANVNIKTLKPVQVYSDINGKKAIATVPAGKVLENASVVYDNADEDAHGFTKVETASDNFLTANTDYVEIDVPTANVPANNAPKSNFSFNLQNPNQKLANYYNNDSQN